MSVFLYMIKALQDEDLILIEKLNSLILSKLNDAEQLFFSLLSIQIENENANLVT